MWQSLGGQFHFDESGPKLSLIKAEHPTDPVACCREIFHHWLTGNGVRPCSWRTLIELLDDIDQDVLAMEVQKLMLSNKGTV